MQHNSLHGSGLAHLLQIPEANTLNLTVLRRIDPTISQVLACANHVALYNFDRPQHRWVRKDVEGSFFLIQRTSQPFHQIIILNKKSTDNYVEDIVSDLSFELTLPYIMYRNTADEVVGVWFYEEGEARKVAALLQQISAQKKALGHTARSSSLAQQMDAQPTSPSTGPVRVGITSMADRDLQHTTDGDLWRDSVQHHHLATTTSEPGNGNAQDGSKAMSEPNALEKLFAKLKVPDSSQAPVAQSMPLLPVLVASTADCVDMGVVTSGQAYAPTMAVTKSPQDGISMSPAGPPPQPPRPTLLTPKFLAAAKAQPRSPAASHSQAYKLETESGDAQASDSMPKLQTAHKDEDSLTRFFMRGSTPAATPMPAAHPDAGAKRERLRKAITALAESDAFMDIIAEELSSAGLLV
ncbi:hypothetical protein CVIRNUC_007217 [Coccomyxa viridis]|uniref:mRNA-decapping enzyme-like protein n=1 Tax=Coccomyxa viridis TaxID=1274662 RepID=A0AAV1IAB4_9CHLO|nr:hypothetical protein CVIRNUC_007217 [Coccomyxa viridis]